MLKRGSRRGQVTVFIIIGIIIVAVAVLLFLFWPKIKTLFVAPSDPQSYVQDCVQSTVKENIKYLSDHGGSFDLKPNVMYNGVNISYLCYTSEYYLPCVMQKPMLQSSIEDDLKNSIEDKLDSCFSEVVKNYEGKGFSVNLEKRSFVVGVLPKTIRIFANYTITTNKDGTANRFENFNLDVRSNLFELTSIAQSIANWEARYGDSETTLYMTYYPELKVEKLLRDDGTKIYTITDRNTKEKFVFATRSVAWPAGYG